MFTFTQKDLTEGNSNTTLYSIQNKLYKFENYMLTQDKSKGIKTVLSVDHEGIKTPVPYEAELNISKEGLVLGSQITFSGEDLVNNSLSNTITSSQDINVKHISNDLLTEGYYGTFIGTDGEPYTINKYITPNISKGGFTGASFFKKADGTPLEYKGELQQMDGAVATSSVALSVDGAILMVGFSNDFGVEADPSGLTKIKLPKPAEGKITIPVLFTNHSGGALLEVLEVLPSPKEEDTIFTTKCYAIGENRGGRFGNLPSSLTEWTLVADLSGASNSYYMDVILGYDCLITSDIMDYHVAGLGTSTHGKLLGTDEGTTLTTFTELGADRGVTYPIALNSNIVASADNRASYVVSGLNANGELGVGHTDPVDTPIYSEVTAGDTSVRVAAIGSYEGSDGVGYTCIIDSNGIVKVSGKKPAGSELTFTDSTTFTQYGDPIPDIGDSVLVACTRDSIIITKGFAVTTMIVLGKPLVGSQPPSRVSIARKEILLYGGFDLSGSVPITVTFDDDIDIKVDIESIVLSEILFTDNYSATPPTDAETLDTYQNTITGEINVFTGSKWVVLPANAINPKYRVLDTLPVASLKDFKSEVYAIDTSTEYVCVASVANPTSDADCFWLQR